MLNLEQLPLIRLLSVQGETMGTLWVVLQLGDEQGNLWLHSNTIPFFCLFGYARPGLELIINDRLGINYGEYRSGATA
jgi:hypothetical protein